MLQAPTPLCSPFSLVATRAFRRGCRCRVERRSHRTLREAVRTQGEKIGVRWADALSSSVRPVTTYWFMALYCAAKTATVAAALTGGAGWVLPSCMPGRKQIRLCGLRCSTSGSSGACSTGGGHLCDPKHPPITEAEAEVYLGAICRRH